MKRAIHQHDVPDGVEQNIALVGVEVTDQVVEDLLAAKLEIVGFNIGGPS
jgi:hypothetical protein